MFEDGVVLGMGVGIRATKDAAIVAFTAGGNTALLSGVRRRAYPWAFVSKVSLFIFSEPKMQEVYTQPRLV